MKIESNATQVTKLGNPKATVPPGRVVDRPVSLFRMQTKSYANELESCRRGRYSFSIFISKEIINKIEKKKKRREKKEKK